MLQNLAVGSKFKHVNYVTGKLQRSVILENLASHGYCLYRSTNLQNDLISEDDQIAKDSIDHAQRSIFGEGFANKLMGYGIGTDARDKYRKSKLMSVSKISHTHWVPYHNELMYTDEFPRFVAFFCMRAATKDGFTPLSNSLDVYKAMPKAMRDRFDKYGITYIRNLRDCEEEKKVEDNSINMGGQKSMQDIFGTNIRSEISAKCKDLGYEETWTECPVNKTPILRIKYVAPATIDYEFQGNVVRGFSNAVTGLNGRYFRNYGDDYFESLEFCARPFHTLWGDGEEFDEQQYQTIEQCQSDNSVRFTWQEGDVIIADNVVWAHGRYPYEGDRSILALMGDPLHRSGLMAEPKL